MNLEDKCKIFIIYEYIIDRPNYPGNSIKFYLSYLYCQFMH